MTTFMVLRWAVVTLYYYTNQPTRTLEWPLVDGEFLKAVSYILFPTTLQHPSPTIPVQRKSLFHTQNVSLNVWLIRVAKRVLNTSKPWLVSVEIYRSDIRWMRFQQNGTVELVTGIYLTMMEPQPILLLLISPIYPSNSDQVWFRLDWTAPRHRINSCAKG